MDSEKITPTLAEDTKPFTFKSSFFASLFSLGLIAVVIAIYSFLGESNFARVGGEPVHGIKGFLVTILFGLLGSLVMSVFVWGGSKIHHLVLKVIYA